MRVCSLILLCALTAVAAESVVLSNGFRIRVDRHEVDGARVRLYTGAGITEIAADAVSAFEAEDRPETVPIATAASAPVAAPDRRDRIAAAAERHGLPEGLVRSVAAAESAFRADAISPKGAVGIMQLMPATARAFNADPKDPDQNVEAGVRYLKELLLKYNGSVSTALAAYNAGPGAVAKYGGVPPFRETQNYVNRVLGTYKKTAGE